MVDRISLETGLTVLRMPSISVSRANGIDFQNSGKLWKSLKAAWKKCLTGGREDGRTGGREDRRSLRCFSAAFPQLVP